MIPVIFPSCGEDPGLHAKDITTGASFRWMTPKVGYIRLTQFGEKTADELERCEVGRRE